MRTMLIATRRVLLTGIVFAALSLGATIGLAQGGGAARAAAPEVINRSDDPLLEPFRFRSIGPASMGGRIDDVAVSESNPSS